MVTQIESHLVCATCGQPIEEGAAVIACPQCEGVIHQACWERDGKCPACAVLEETVSPGAEIRRETVLEPRPESMSEATLWSIIGVIVLVLVGTGIIFGMRGVRIDTILVVGVVIAALAFDYVNGMHDSGNAIATVISTRVLTPSAALVMAALLNLLGALIHTGVAHSIATKFADLDKIDPMMITPMMILCGLIGASIWSFLTARWGLPVSTSHSLLGGLLGVFLLAGIPLNTGYIGKIGLFMVLAPLMAFSVGWALMLVLTWIFRNMAPHRINKHFRGLQVISSAGMAFMHGSNDAQKAMGIITMALFSGGFLHAASADEVQIPLWVKLACALVMALGTGFGGMRVIRTLGHKIIKLAPIHGFTAETVASATIALVTFLKVPISTTHVISSSILGIGASRRLSAVRWGVATNIVLAWLFTIPTTAIAGALLYKLVTVITHIR